MADRCWKCKQAFAPGEKPMQFSYDGAMITRHDSCVPALLCAVDRAVEALRGLVEACEAFRGFVANEQDNGVGEIEARNAMFVALRAAKEVLRGQ